MVELNGNMLSKYELYIFDFDLTLADTRKTAEIAYKRVFERCGVYYDNNKLFDFLSEPLEMTYSKVLHPLIDFKTFKYIFNKEMHEHIQSATIYKDAIDFITKLRNLRKKLAIVTNKDSDSIKIVLEKYNLLNAFLTLVCARDVVNMKPNKEPIVNCLRKTNNSPIEAIYFGDALNDFICTQNAGVDFIYVDRYKRELPINESVIRIKSFNEILFN